jgi:hypothetical protein
LAPHRNRGRCRPIIIGCLFCSKLFSSAGWRLAGGEAVERRLDCMVLDQHHFENGLAAANFLSLTAKTVPGAEAFWMIVGMLTLLIDSSMSYCADRCLDGRFSSLGDLGDAVQQG